MEAPMRDPRVDPRPGDEIRVSPHRILKVIERSGYTVRVASLDERVEIHGDDVMLLRYKLAMWMANHATASVVRVADDEGG
jgi:hypothetical protein